MCSTALALIGNARTQLADKGQWSGLFKADCF